MNSKYFDELTTVFASLKDKKEIKTFLQEILTPAECASITKRWQLLRDLNNNKSQRTIAKELKISLCKITRGAKILKHPQSMVAKAIKEKHYIPKRCDNVRLKN